jgi:hypothetical protein
MDNTNEEMVAGPIGGGPVDMPSRPLPKAKKRKYKDFDVPSDVFRRFQKGRTKFERWSKYLNLEDSSQKAIYDYARKNRDAVVVLRDSTTGALRAIRQRACGE